MYSNNDWLHDSSDNDDYCTACGYHVARCTCPGTVTDGVEAPLWAPPPTQSTDQDRLMYGISLLAYLLSADVDLYGMCSDDQLALAEHAAYFAVTAREILPRAVDRISEVRSRILHVLAARKLEAPVQPTAVAPTRTPAPNEGPMAPLTPKPYTRPPAGQKVEIQF